MNITEFFRVGTNYEPVFLAASLSIILSSILVPLSIKLSNKLNVLDRPTAGSHKTHAQPIPYLGGMAIATASILTSALVIGFGDYSAEFANLNLVFSVGLIAMAFLGLADDLKPKGAKQRLVIQSLIALLVSFFLFELDFVSVRVTTSQSLNILVCTFLLVSICNFLNMFDNHDGSASGVSLLILLSILFLSMKTGQTLVSIFSSILLFAVLPFLVLNLPPARVYLGDSGATFLGTSIGILLVAIDFTSLSPFDSILASFCLIGILILDFSVAVISRIRRGISPMIGDKAHIAHRLMRLTRSKEMTTVLIWLVTIWFGVHGSFAVFSSEPERQLIFTSAFLSYLILCYLFLRQPDE